MDGDDAAAAVARMAAKPALKKKLPLHNGQGDVKKKKALKWDEVAIEEHDQLRGTRMKIDEPNTPYTHYDSGAESDGSHPKSPLVQKNTLNWDQLQNKLTDVATNYPSSPSSFGGGDFSDEDRKLEFLEHRKKHYNEMELVRKFRAEHPDDMDEDDDDDDAY